MKKNLTPLIDILESLFKKKHSVFYDIYFLYCLKQAWPELAGNAIAQTGQPLSFKNQELTIALPSSSHLQEMHFIKEALRKKIKASFPHIKIKKIILQVKAPFSDRFTLTKNT